MIAQLYAAALHGTVALQAEYPDGSRVPVPVRDWCGDLLPGDTSVLDRCVGATLDVGCGPGRLAASLGRNGIPAMGIDTHAEAVRLAQAAGAHAELCCVFGPVARSGEWATALLVDGNIGIGGRPVRLLRRLATLLAPAGRVLVEVDPPTRVTEQTTLRLVAGERRSASFPWAHLCVRDAADVAAAAGLRLRETWKVGGRWFVRLDVA